MRWLVFLGLVAAALVACSPPSHPEGAQVDAVTARTEVSSDRAAAVSVSVAHPSVAASVSSSPARARMRTLIHGPRFDNPTPMLVDEKDVYVSAAGRLLVVPKDGSAPHERVLEKANVTVFSADATDLYLGVYPVDGPNSSGAILRVDKKTRTPTVIAQTEMVTAITVDEQYIWFGVLSEGAYRVDKKGGKPKALFTKRGYVNAVAQDDEAVYFGVTNYGANARAEIAVVKKKGGAFTILTTEARDLMALVALPDAVVANDNGTIMRFARAGGAAEKVSGLGSALGLTHRGSEVLYTDLRSREDTEPVGVFVAGQPPTLVIESPAAVGIAVDEHTVYWADAVESTLSALELSVKVPSLR